MGRQSGRSRNRRAIERRARPLLRWLFAETVVGEAMREAMLVHPAIFGDRERLHIAPEVVVNDTLFNCESGSITVGRAAFFGHGVSLLTGTHEVDQLGVDRQRSIPPDGHDILIEEGAWVSSNATVLGPCRIGAHAVVAAGSVVRDDVPPFTVVAGVPAREVARLVGGDPDPSAA